MERESEPVYLYSLFYFYMVFVIASLANLHMHAFPIQGTLYFKSQYYHPSISLLEARFGFTAARKGRGGSPGRWI